MAESKNDVISSIRTYLAHEDEDVARKMQDFVDATFNHVYSDKLTLTKSQLRRVNITGDIRPRSWNNVRKTITSIADEPSKPTMLQFWPLIKLLHVYQKSDVKVIKLRGGHNAVRAFEPQVSDYIPPHVDRMKDKLAALIDSIDWDCEHSTLCDVLVDIHVKVLELCPLWFMNVEFAMAMCCIAMHRNYVAFPLSWRFPDWNDPFFDAIATALDRNDTVPLHDLFQRSMDQFENHAARFIKLSFE